MANTLFITVGGSQYGFGHLRRVSTIAKYLRKTFTDEILFLINDDPQTAETLAQWGVPYITEKSINQISSDFAPDTAVIDTKEDRSSQIRQLREKGIKTCLLDNTTPARMEADINIYPVAHFQNIQDWTGYQGQVYTGAKYVLLDESFLNQPPSNQRDTLLITMGASDPNALTLKVLEAIKELSLELKIKVVCGPLFDFKEALYKLKEETNCEVFMNVNNMPQLMASAAIAITAFGVTVYELAYMGVPTVIINNYAHEAEEVSRFADFGSAASLGFYKNVSKPDIQQAIGSIIEDKAKKQNMRFLGRSLVDGKGCERIAELIRGTIDNAVQASR